jgi:hypothetical protein
MHDTQHTLPGQKMCRYQKPTGNQETPLKFKKTAERRGAVFPYLLSNFVIQRVAHV